MSVNSKMTAIADAIRSLLNITGTLGLDAMATKLNGIAKRTASNLSASGATVTVPAGYYASQATKSVATATQATPSVSIDSAGKITASATQSAGYVAAGTKSATKQLTTQAAKTVTPGTSEQTAVASGVYTTGAVKVAGDANLKAENIAEGVSIFGVPGAHKGGGGTVDVTIKKPGSGVASAVYVYYKNTEGSIGERILTGLATTATITIPKGSAFTVVAVSTIATGTWSNSNNYRSVRGETCYAIANEADTLTIAF